MKNNEIEAKVDKIVFLDGPTLDADMFTTSDVIAKYAQVEPRAVRQLIRQYASDLEEFGFSTFEMSKLPGRGRPHKIYHLNEEQATLLITYLGNTAPVRAFKKELVHQFYSMKQELLKRQTLREIEKPVRRSLTDAIKDWPYCNRWSYKTLTDLICKTATGLNTKQYKAAKGISKGASGLDIYSANDLAKYQAVESKVVVLLDLRFSYDQLKSAISGQPITVTLPVREMA